MRTTDSITTGSKAITTLAVVALATGVLGAPAAFPGLAGALVPAVSANPRTPSSIATPSNPAEESTRPAPSLPQEPPRFTDIWLWRRADDTLRRVTEATGAGRESTAATVSADGRLVAFHSDDDFLGEGIPNGTDEIWLLEVETQALRRVTVASDSSRDSRNPAISADGSRIVFDSDADFRREGLAAGQREIWLYDAGSETVGRLTRANAPGAESAYAVISADGATVAFASNANFDGNGARDAVDIWRIDLDSGALQRVTRGSDGRTSSNPDVNADGTRLVFESDADLLDQGLPRGQRELWLYDATADSFTRITHGGDTSRASEAASISADGNRLAFYSDADLLGEGRPDSVDEVWLYDVRSATLRRITSLWVPERDAGTNPVLHPDAESVEITADGGTIVFASDGDLLDEGLPSGYPHVWIYDIAGDELRRIDTSAGTGSGVAISADASHLVLHGSDFDLIRWMRTNSAAGSSRPETLTADAIDRDLDALQAELEARWAYLKANGVDYAAAIDEIRTWATAQSGTEIDYDAYGIEVQKLISRFIDGHSGVGGFRYPGGYLPFFLEPSGERFVGILPDRSGYLAEGYPFVRAIDGVTIERWIAAAAPYNPRGSRQYVTWRGLRQMSLLQFLRGVMGMPQTDTLRVELISTDGSATREIALPVADSRPSGSIWPRAAQSGLIDGDVGYIRIASMTPDAAVELDAWMERFRDTRGLIVDVRGNGGGLRHPLRALYPYLVGDAEPPRVINAAKYRPHPDHTEDHLGGSRFLYRESWPGWTDAERQGIARFRETFTPEWDPPEDEFSEWHYLVLSRANNPNAYVYGKPVIVLMDEKCFSATDIFLSGLKGVAGVTLMGYPSGGGSARAMGARLPESALSLRLASMASFQRTGRLYDGNGIEPDVIVDPAPDYFLNGGTDNMLAEALRRLNR